MFVLLAAFAAAALAQSQCDPAARMKCTADVGTCIMAAGIQQAPQAAPGVPTPPPMPPTPPMPGCNSTGLDKAADKFSTCANSASNNAAICPCFAPFLGALERSHCVPQNNIDATENSCRQIGCSRGQCQARGPRPPMPPTPPGHCDPMKAADCARTMRGCVAVHSDHDGLCTCYGTYLTCIHDTDCLNKRQMKAQERACTDAMCTHCPMF